MDFGGKRIGLAAADSAAGLPRPLAGLAASGTLRTDARAVAAVASAEEAGLVVVGLPLLEGEETKMSGVCRKLAAELEALGLAVELVDEALTSREAHSAMAEAGVRGARRRRLVDSEAACRIAERYLEAARD